MSDLSTNYLGLRLRNPLVASASPLNAKVSNIVALEEYGAGAVVLPSIFEEQIEAERVELQRQMSAGSESFAEALSYFPNPEAYLVGSARYLDLIRLARESVEIPIIASLNGATGQGWMEYAKEIQDAGASALELNIYFIPADLTLGALDVERRYAEIVASVAEVVEIPIAVKLSPYFSALGGVAQRLRKSGADGLVLFNRFYQPDIDLEELEIKPNILLSTPMAMRLPLRWVAILYGKLRTSLAATSGMHRGTDVLKMLMAGADVTMLCSTLMRHGLRQIQLIEREMVSWMEEHEYESVKQLKGSLSQKNCGAPSEFERAQYMRAISNYTPV